MTLGEFIKQRRTELGLSLSDLGEAISYTPQAISRFEKGLVNVSLDLLAALAIPLQCDVSSFFTLMVEERHEGFEPFDIAKFANAIVYFRNTRGYSQKELAGLLGISKAKLSRWEQGDRLPDVEEFKTLCKLLEVPTLILYYGRTPGNASVQMIGEKPKSSRVSKVLLYAGIAFLVGAISVTGGVLISNAINKEHNKPEDSSSSSSNSNNEDTYYTVEFYFDLINTSETQEVPAGKQAKMPEFNEPGYNLLGYYLDKGDGAIDTVQFDFSTAITSSIRIIGKLEVATYQVDFLGYDNKTVLKSENVEYSKDATPPDPQVVDGYTFLSWSNYKNITQDTLVYSYYKKNEGITATLDLDGGEFSQEQSTTLTNFSYSMLASLPSIIKKGHAFQYWEYDGAKVTESTTFTSTSITLKAIYTANQYTLTLKYSQEDKLTFNYGSAITGLPASDPVTGSSMDGWVINGEIIHNGDIYSWDKDLDANPYYTSIGFTAKELTSETLSITSITCYSTTVTSLSIPATLNGKTVSRIEEGAVSENFNAPITNLEVLGESVEIRKNAFKNLTSLKTVSFPNASSSSLFYDGIFYNCGELSEFTAAPAKDEQGNEYLLTDYGIAHSSESFKLTFNDKFNSIPENFNKDFGTITCIDTGDGIQEIINGHLTTIGVGVKEFIPGKNIGALHIALPDLDQETMTIYSSVEWKNTGSTFGKLNKLVLKSVSDLYDFNQITINTFIAESGVGFHNETLIYTSNIQVTTNIQVINTTTVFESIGSNDVYITFTGATTEEIPENLQSITFVGGEGTKHYSYTE